MFWGLDVIGCYCCSGVQLFEVVVVLGSASKSYCCFGVQLLEIVVLGFSFYRLLFWGLAFRDCCSGVQILGCCCYSRVQLIEVVVLGFNLQRLL